MASNTRVTRTMLGCSKRASVRASSQEVGAAPVECLLVAVRLGPHAHRSGALAEIVGVVFLDRHHGAEVDVLGLIGDAEPARADHAHDAIAAIEEHSRAAEPRDCPMHSLRPCQRTLEVTKDHHPGKRASASPARLARAPIKAAEKRRRLFPVEQHSCAFANY